MMIVVVIFTDGDTVVGVDNDSFAHATTHKNTMNEKGGGVIINAK